jgi:hypothetical protein
MNLSSFLDSSVGDGVGDGLYLYEIVVDLSGQL